MFLSDFLQLAKYFRDATMLLYILVASLLLSHILWYNIPVLVFTWTHLILFKGYLEVRLQVTGQLYI